MPNHTIQDAIKRMIDRLSRDASRYTRAEAAQLAVWAGEGKQPPLLLRCGLDAAWDVPDYTPREIHFDAEKMLAHGLRAALSACFGGAEAVPSVRANMGCGIFATMFGVKQRLFDDKMPWVTAHIPKEILQNMTADDLTMGEEFRAALAHMEYMSDALKGSGVRIYPLDLQGAFDIAHIVYGDDLFYALYDDPAFVHHLLSLCCEAAIRGMRAVFERIPESDRIVAHYNDLVMPRASGGVKLSEDTSTLLSEQQIRAFVVPYIDRLLKHFGGGYIHYCGYNPFLYEAVVTHPLVRGINFGNPEKHDMKAVLRRCAALGKVYYGGLPAGDTDRVDFYASVLEASQRQDGTYILLMSEYCEADEREAVHTAWQSAI